MEIAVRFDVERARERGGGRADHLDRYPGDVSTRPWSMGFKRDADNGDRRNGGAPSNQRSSGYQRRHGLAVTHAWGMTETNPLGTLARVKRSIVEGGADDAKTLAVRSTQGYPVAFVEQRHRRQDGAILPWDGKTMGELKVRGPWVASSYFGGEGPDPPTAGLRAATS